jgi:hypothetical protein
VDGASKDHDGRIKRRLEAAEGLGSRNQLLIYKGRYNFLNSFVIPAFHEQRIAKCCFLTLDRIVYNKYYVYGSRMASEPAS